MTAFQAVIANKGNLPRQACPARHELNDLADADTDRLNPKKGSREHRLGSGERGGGGGRGGRRSVPCRPSSSAAIRSP